MKLVDAGGINTLVELCKRDNGLIMQYTAVAIGNLSAGSKRYVSLLLGLSATCSCVAWRAKPSHYCVVLCAAASSAA